MSERIPDSVYVGLSRDDGLLHLAVYSRQKDLIFSEHLSLEARDLADQVLLNWVSQYQDYHKIKIVGIGISELEDPELTGEKLWLEHDVVPFLERGLGGTAQIRAENLARYVANKFRHDGYLDIPLVKVDEHRQVHPSYLTTFEAYERALSSENIQRLKHETERFKSLGGRILFINSTAQGGGVALMRHAQLRLYRLLGLDAKWLVMKPDAEIFPITKKKFHNVLQGVATSDTFLTEEDKQKYNAWIEENVKIFEPHFQRANVIVIDDWQPSGLIPHIKKINPNIKILFRSHIHVDTSLMTPGSNSSVTWDFLWNQNQICQTDIFISHPISYFIPEVVPVEKVVLMPATTDPLDGLNKPLTDAQSQFYLEAFNRILTDGKQAPLDTSRPYITQIARFDPSKGIPDVLISYHKLRKKYAAEGRSLAETPQLVIAGHGAVDDPEGMPIFLETKRTLEIDTYKDIAQDIKIARFPHNDQILDAIIRGAQVVMQLSHKEGLEIKVTEAVHKGKPIIIYNRGGMPLQVLDGINSFVIEQGQCQEVSDRLYELLSQPDLYNRMSQNAREKVKEDFFTVNNSYKWLFMANELLEAGRLLGQARNLNDLIRDKQEVKQAG
jgi:alpha,alpha-trehalose phosphorylase (configuration-retaining)